MSKKEVCNNSQTIAVYNGLNGVEIKSIEYGINDYIYSVSGIFGGGIDCHRSKVYYTLQGEPYFKLYGYRIHLSECLRV